MAKFRKAFAGVPAGEIYPVEYAKGEECPPELLDAAIAVGAVKAPKAPAPDTEPDPGTNPDTDPAEEEDDDEVDAEAGDGDGGGDVVLEDGTDAA
ncbi:MAG: hypothetical protein BWX69_03053 [Planctomycetes bacterium ADurb.Bin069]|nr:MAG: hypothetical protein BWX69_03053 [Planctomycetes bacterium ADurb.Bin069]